MRTATKRDTPQSPLEIYRLEKPGLDLLDRVSGAPQVALLVGDFEPDSGAWLWFQTRHERTLGSGQKPAVQATWAAWPRTASLGPGIGDWNRPQLRH